MTFCQALSFDVGLTPGAYAPGLALDQNCDERWPLNPCTQTRIPFMAGQEKESGTSTYTTKQGSLLAGPYTKPSTHRGFNDLKRSDYLVPYCGPDTYKPGRSQAITLPPHGVSGCYPV